MIGSAADGEVEDYQVTVASPAATSGVFGGQNIVTTGANAARSVFAADVDGDGDMDMLSASIGDDKIAWYENDGSENFSAHTISNTADNVHSVFAADMDGDGDLDVLSASLQDDKIAWYENDGSQNFTAHTITTAANGAVSVFAADMDGDGDMDIVSSWHDGNTIAWHENDGSQNFSTHTVSTSALGVISIFAADVDSDGDLDLLSALNNDKRIVWYENDGSQGFAEHTISSNAKAAVSVFAVDMDGDGDTDVLSASTWDFSNLSPGDKIAWYENDGSQHFTEHTISSVLQGGAYWVFAADIDGDDDMDVLSASYNSPSFNISTIAWHENDGSENFTAHTISTAVNVAQGVFAADVDGDGDLDALSASLQDNEIAWYENTNAPPSVSLTLSPAMIAENGGTATVTATLSNVYNQAVTVNLGFTGNATNNTDYSANAAMIVILAGQTSGAITLTGINDITYEGNESIIVDVTGVTNGTENGTQSVTATITDNDAQPSVSLALSGSPLAENGGTATVRATMSNPSTQNVAINLGFTGTATNSADYSASSNMIVILAGQTSGAITLTSINDSLSENVESIIVDVTTVNNGTENGVQQVTANIGNVLPAVVAANTPGLTADPTRYSVNAQTLTIRGTPGVDDIRINATQFYTFFNNEVFVFSSATINQVIVLADSGKDVLTFIGSPSVTENATLNPSSFAYSVSGLAIQADAEVQYIFGQSGDSATLGDSATDDVVYMRQEYSYLFDRATTYVSQPIGFGNVTINATSSGTDQIIMLGDSGDQTFNMTPTQTSLVNSGVTMIANSFEYQVALGQGGNDTANLVGSAGNDVYTRKASPATRTPGNPATSILIVGSSFEQVFDISTINVQSGGGTDIAILNDSAGDDTLVGSPAETTLQTPYSLDRVTGFRGVYAIGSTGNDTATLDGSNSDDLFQGTANSSVLYRSGVYTLQADAFDLVHANLTGAGNDIATLIDSAGNDTLTAQSNFAQLQYANGNRVRVTAFDTVFARGSNGGVNTRNVSNPLTYSLIFSGTWV